MRREIKGFHAVKEAAKDFENFSSNLLGDRDVRTYRQLPLEADPPIHTLFREAVQPYFMASRIQEFKPDFEKLAQQLISDAVARGGVEVTKELALPYVLGSLGIIFNRPQDVDEWISWGPDVWTAEDFMNGRLDQQSVRAHQDRDFSRTSSRSGKVLQSYLDRVFSTAIQKEQDGQLSDDLWDFIARLEIQERKVTRDEMWGIANVLLAGGRDTVIKLISGLVWHLVRNETDREFLAENANWHNRAIAELVRYLSPLPKMERAPKEQALLPDAERNPDEYILLNFVSANHDPRVWKNPESIDIHRERQPHMAFGFGRHSCLGMNVTEIEVGSFLSVFLSTWQNWQLASEPEIEWVSDLDADGNNFSYIEKFLEIKLVPS